MRSILPMFALAFAISTPALAQDQIIALPSFDAVELRGGGDVDIVPGPVQRVVLMRLLYPSPRSHLWAMS